MIARNLAAVLIVCVSWATLARGEEPVDFGRDIQPILSDTCYRCHGPDAGQRQADLRLDVESSAKSLREGVRAIVPGQRDDSELWKRITTADPDLRMPPPDSGRSLTPAQRELLGRWIDEGAKWSRHWSFAAPTRPTPPPVRQAEWVRNPVDRFVLARLEAERLAPTAEADRYTLIRRLSFDLTGLPPTPQEAAEFIHDSQPDAYERLADRLLSSPRFGERLAVGWLDLSRYADTNGYQVDNERFMWRWRDWVIQSFNDNKPFDRFAVEQLAGDLLPGATLEQRIATGFNRNHPTTFEGGVIPEEYRIEYVIDRVNTASTAFLGLTLGCARCHDHKYDPFAQKEFYRLFAYFNNVPELGLDGVSGNSAPEIPAPTRTQQLDLARLEEQRQALEARLQAENPQLDLAQRERLTLEIEAVRKQQELVQAAVKNCMVMSELPQPREAHVLTRGQYDQPGETVLPGTPAALHPLPDQAPSDRRGLAAWIVDPGNPLTARVAVNRLWQTCFGSGLVTTPEDFGLQGERPTHPELLDWLAVEFVESGWDIKALVRLMVTSATYRQASVAAPETLKSDPLNRLLGRISRTRLSAEQIRDNALAVSGLLTERLGGPSVKPYQPDLWTEISSGAGYKAQIFEQDHGPDLYRRSLYTFWKRASPPPGLQTFDAPTREFCVINRSRTNTPLQALVLMNDPTYVEAARVLAERVLKDAGADPAARIEFAFRRTLARPPSPEEQSILQKLLAARLAEFQANPEAAGKLLSVGEHVVDPALDKAELAAWATVASVLLNLDETVTKP